MQSSLKNDLNRLSELAYHREEWSGPTVEAFHRIRKIAVNHPDFYFLEQSYAWVLVPFCLWVLDFHELCRLIQTQIEAGKPVEAELRLLVNSLPPLPDKKAQTAAMAHEHAVQHGNYESLVKADKKFSGMETKLLGDPEFQKAWEDIQAHFDIQKFQDSKGIIRRRMVTERNMHNDNAIRWNTKAGRFQVIFDAFCQRWNLYGMKEGQPLLLKISSNLTPFGTLIFIPAYWSLDFKLDFKLKEITDLHRSRGVKKQGDTIFLNWKDRKEKAALLPHLDAEVLRLGLKGDKKTEFLCKELGYNSRVEQKQISRLRAEFKKYRTDTSSSKK